MYTCFLSILPLVGGISGYAWSIRVLGVWVLDEVESYIRAETKRRRRWWGSAIVILMRRVYVERGKDSLWDVV
jgi:hypothetical protein